MLILLNIHFIVNNNFLIGINGICSHAIDLLISKANFVNRLEF